MVDIPQELRMKAESSARSTVIHRRNGTDGRKTVHFTDFTEDYDDADSSGVEFWHEKSPGRAACLRNRGRTFSRKKKNEKEIDLELKGKESAEEDHEEVQLEENEE